MKNNEAVTALETIKHVCNMAVAGGVLKSLDEAFATFQALQVLNIVVNKPQTDVEAGKQ